MIERFLLDTNVISELQKPRPNPRLGPWMEQRRQPELFISSISLGEIWRGVVQKEEGRKKQDLIRWCSADDGPARYFAGRVLALDERAALQWGEFLAEGHRLGRPRSPIDMQIAAIAKVNDCALVTMNATHFMPVRDSLRLVTPAEMSRAN